MKNSRLTNFTNQQLSEAAVSNLKGGNNFCEWYVSYCEENGLAVNSNVMKRLAKCDRIASRRGEEFVLNKYDNLFGRLNYPSA